MTRIARAVAAFCVLLPGCGDAAGVESGEQLVRRWADAINARDWERACSVSDGVEPCVAKLRRDFGRTIRIRPEMTIIK